MFFNHDGGSSLGSSDALPEHAGMHLPPRMMTRQKPLRR
jgi:hypothetical protein